MGPHGPQLDTPAPVAAPPKKSAAHRCADVARIAHYAGHVADIISTKMAIDRGAVEKNGFATALFGDRPKVWQMILFKVPFVVGSEALDRSLRKRGEYGRACALHTTGAAITWTVAGLNMRYVF